ncbi:hypothetical protein [Pseudalkalibacillus hwajinpoensis]|uniref:Uncharacterized protein n=1 Tax=Guptibacillus hwajinpoensis TaxID=208199 RepID=A0A4U1ML23_9BACL|nr:hypothetical protein [Pseudalkalibacillus hwajinpoensis]TKD71325.1 hypothetical protein FBF83_00495 [Pseudalkalibacillus hwajinpoensis]
MNKKKKNQGKGKTATMMALSALGGAAAYGLTNRFRDEYNAQQNSSQTMTHGNKHTMSQQPAHNSSNSASKQSFTDMTNAAKGMGIDNSAIEEFTNAIKDDLK